MSKPKKIELEVVCLDCEYTEVIIPDNRHHQNVTKCTKCHSENVMLTEVEELK